MFKVPFDYYAPDNLQKAVALREQFKGKSRILAGGTDLLIALQKEDLGCEAIIDIKKVDELKGIEKKDHYLAVGANVPFANLMCHSLIKKYTPLMAQASSTVGSPQIRNRGTVGGNLGTGSAAGDLLTALVALEAIVVVTGFKGLRQVPVTDFLGGNNAEKLQNTEIIREVRIPLGENQNIRSAFIKLGRRKALAVSRLSLALNLEMQEEFVAKARLSVGAAGPIPFRVIEAEQILAQKNNKFEAKKVMDLVSYAVLDSLGERPSAPYKIVAVKGLVLEALQKCGLI